MKFSSGKLQTNDLRFFLNWTVCLLSHFTTQMSLDRHDWRNLGLDHSSCVARAVDSSQFHQSFWLLLLIINWGSLISLNPPLMILECWFCQVYLLSKYSTPRLIDVDWRLTLAYPGTLRISNLILMHTIKQYKVLIARQSLRPYIRPILLF